ncbi:MAG: polyamine ABC transporter ATP-binding protein [Acidihalobacter sp.]|uniref:ABC transporter ATP-binding protein n=1 Tax=Acidihalobacter sp. TaxID=1872108 RepID=UPI00307D5287
MAEQTTTIAASTADEHYVRLERLRKEFDGTIAVFETNLDIHKGEIFALLGSTGCGKTTLLRMLSGFETPSAGRILIDGEDMTRVAPHHRPTNMMFQSYAIFPHMTVEQNIAFGLKQEGQPREQIRKTVREMLELVRMTPYAKRKPHQLSGGQRQRVALARSLAKRPKLLLLDEPMSALDKKLRNQVQFEIVNILEQLGMTCVIVTHDQEEAMTMAHRMAVMDQGEILQVGTPSEIYEHPNCRFTAEFIGSVNLFEGTLTEDEPDHVIIESNEACCPIRVGHGISGTLGMQVWAAIRPEKIRIQREPSEHGFNCAQGTVDEIGYQGSHSIYHVRLDSGKRAISTQPNLSRDLDERPTWGDRVYLSWDEHAAVVLTR